MVVVGAVVVVITLLLLLSQIKLNFWKHWTMSRRRGEEGGWCVVSRGGRGGCAPNMNVIKLFSDIKLDLKSEIMKISVLAHLWSILTFFSFTFLIDWNVWIKMLKQNNIYFRLKYDDIKYFCDVYFLALFLVWFHSYVSNLFYSFFFSTEGLLSCLCSPKRIEHSMFSRLL